MGAGHDGSVDVTESLELISPPSQVFALVEDLGRYPDWLSIVSFAEVDVTVTGADAGGAASSRPGSSGGTDEGPAWTVELRGRVGPLTRSKRLRMVRTRHEPDRLVRFERREQDGRDHSEWILDAIVEPVGDGSRVTMSLHYGGRFPTGFIEGILHEEIESSRTRLADAVDAQRA